MPTTTRINQTQSSQTLSAAIELDSQRLVHILLQIDDCVLRLQDEQQPQLRLPFKEMTGFHVSSLSVTEK